MCGVNIKLSKNHAFIDMMMLDVTYKSSLIAKCFHFYVLVKKNSVLEKTCAKYDFVLLK